MTLWNTITNLVSSPWGCHNTSGSTQRGVDLCCCVVQVLYFQPIHVYGFSDVTLATPTWVVTGFYLRFITPTPLGQVCFSAGAHVDRWVAGSFEGKVHFNKTEYYLNIGNHVQVVPSVPSKAMLCTNTTLFSITEETGAGWICWKLWGDCEQCFDFFLLLSLLPSLRQWIYSLLK